MARARIPPSDDRLIEAVELRMGGFTWETIAKRLLCSPETVRKWPVKYADRWQAAMDRAERRLAVDTEGEAVVALRSILRGDDTKFRYHAAKAIIAMRIELGKMDSRNLARQTRGPTEIDKAKLMVELLEHTPIEQLCAYADMGFQLLAKSEAGCAVAETVPVSAGNSATSDGILTSDGSNEA